ncbi:TIGR01244 family sulfur transferase [Halocynthiibacter namhaensis]|uniref:TIGR01244 family sulfur transferase n=1 Tax=Halocynthiibacter namhaensis TaxID=1290553 RepID=UPI00068F1A9E|nr:TIGR01244 family sulfur transferase [Halocynthiibacter namhaensis]
MNLRQVSDTLSVCPQLTSSDIAGVVDAGFKSIVCNRPDGEEGAQPMYGEIELAAKHAGLEIRYVPVTAGAISEDNVSEFSQALKELPTPILAYCRSGARCAMLWSLCEDGS